MPVENPVEKAIREAQARGEFDNLKGRGKPLDLTAYFETPEELRLALSALKSADIPSPEVELLQEIAALKEQLTGAKDEGKQAQLRRQISARQLQFDIMMDRLKRRTGRSGL